MNGGERFEAVDWAALVAELVIDLHWTRDAVLDQVDMPFLAQLRRSWSQCPPPRRLIAAWLGYKPPALASRNYQDLLAMFPTGTIR